jgi:hypothetical protein
MTVPVSCPALLDRLTLPVDSPMEYGAIMQECRMARSSSPVEDQDGKARRLVREGGNRVLLAGLDGFGDRPRFVV